MDIKTVLRFNRQLSRLYGLAILHVILSIIGLMLNYLVIKGTYLYVCIFALNVIALVCFEPWKIMRLLHEGYGYKKSLEAIGVKR